MNGYTTANQGWPDVATDAGGNFVVTWMSDGQDMSSYGVFARRYASTGTALGAEFQVNGYTTGFQGFPAVASDTAGNFVVVWENTAGEFGIAAQRFNSSGAAVGSEFQVNDYTTSIQDHPAVASDAAGNVVVVWSSYGQDGDVQGIFGQRYASTGTPLGSEFPVNSYTTGFQGLPAVAADAAGNFMVVWEDYGQEPGGINVGGRIVGQLYDSTGTPVGSEFQANAYTTNGQIIPDVAADGGGNFVVVWNSYLQDGSNFGVFSQRYDSTGTPVGGEFQVNDYTTHLQADPAVAAYAAGNFVVVWDSGPGQDGSSGGVFGIRGPTTTSTSITITTTTTSTTLPPTSLLPGKIVIIKPGTLAKFVAKPPLLGSFALPTANPIVDGGSLRIFDVGTTAGDDSYPLPAGALWDGLGNPPGSNGYKYKGAGTPSDPCKVVLVKETVIKAVCKGSGVLLAPPFTGDIGIVLSLGTTDEYCGQFGGTLVKNTPDLAKRKDAPAPAMCP